MLQTKVHYTINTNQLSFIPYTKEVVETYHKWMQDQEILYLTASEPLTLEEEYENQQDWLNDPLKYTFILKSNEILIGDVNLFFHNYLEINEAEIDVMIGNKDFRGKGLAKLAVQVMMSFAFCKYNRNTFIAKIKETNQASIHLFTKLGFKEIKKVKAFSEIHFQLIIDKPLVDYEIKEIKL